MEIEGLHTFLGFEVINIVDDMNPYYALLGIDWAIDNQTIMNFKKIILSFKDDEMRVVSPIDPLERQRYVKLVNSEGQGDYLDNIYNVRALKYDYVNPIADGSLSWRSASSYTSNSVEAL